MDRKHSCICFSPPALRGARLAALALMAAAGLVLPVHGCAGPPSAGRVILLGIDGVDPHVVDLLMSEGKLPNFAKMRQGGAYGLLRSSMPLLSPVIWTTIATGKTPEQHRIGHFVAVNQVTGEQLPVTSRMRKVKALWGIASDEQKKVAVVGWWATWPAESVDGAIVSDHLCYHFLFEDAFSGGSGPASGNTHPPELEKQVAPLVKRPGDVTYEEVSRFVSVAPEDLARPFSFADDLGHFRWALATADTYTRIGLRLWEEGRPDLMMLYIEGLDSTSHLFGHLFRARGLAGELAEQQKRYGDAVERMYEHADRLLGQFMAAMDRNTTLAVVSDHGFRLGELPDDPSRVRDMRRVSERYHTMDGVLFLYGSRVRPYARIEGATILDVAPTLLGLMDLPAARDMPGRILSEALAGVRPLERVPTFETGGVVKAEGPRDEAAEGEMLERLRSLGYIGTSSPSGDRNLAAVAFEQGRYEEAAAAYRTLVEQDPNDGALRASLAGALGALGRHEEALAQLDAAIRLQPLNPEAYHNRAVIHERRGDREAAARDYGTALKYNPQYEPSRRALRRLLGPGAGAGPETAAERQARALAEQASLAARRGDYPAAVRYLDEAEKIAPRSAIVWQYRSNVAYLMGDRDGAIRALEKGLQIEPDNALFRENLRRLQKQPPRR